MIWHGGRRYQLLEISRVDGQGGYIRESEFSGIGVWMRLGISWLGRAQKNGHTFYMFDQGNIFIPVISS